MIELKNMTKRFNKGTVNETIALDHINLTLEDGDFITVIGGNGAGKSTMMNVIAGTIDADEGMIVLDQKNITRVAEFKRAPFFGRVFQDPMMGTASDMTVIENLALAYGRGKRRSLFAWSYRKKDVAFFINELKSLDLGLEERLYQKVGLLSGGQRQALTLLMAAMRRAPVPSRIKRDYVRFSIGDKKELKNQIDEIFKDIDNDYSIKKKEILNDKSLSKQARKEALTQLLLDRDNAYSSHDISKPILLLDEHTAALDPKTAEKVLETTERIVSEKKLTTIMITHNMKDAIRYGNRLIMMSKGRIVADIDGEEKKKLTIESLLEMFVNSSKNDILADSAILGD